ncbi:hypothetical protein VFPYRCLA_125 [Candidatus Vidania fulgoroideae]|nr:hypothetical protein VFPYRCLA_125 [Candidatus Vidania fulgoroideae]
MIKKKNAKHKKIDIIFVKNRTSLHDNVVISLLSRGFFFYKRKTFLSSKYIIIKKKGYEELKNKFPINNHKRLIFCDSKKGYEITNKTLLDFFAKKKNVNTDTFLKCISLIGTFDLRMYKFLSKRKKKKGNPYITNVFKSKNLIKVYKCIKWK